MYCMPPTPSNPVGIDSHFHVFSAGEGSARARYVPRYNAPYEAWQRQASVVGVTRGVVVQPSFLGTDNTRLCAELRVNPD